MEALNVDVSDGIHKSWASETRLSAWIVSLDCAASAYIQRLELGHLVELAWMIPGTICGVPEACTSVLPALVVLLAEPCGLSLCIFVPQATIYISIFCAVVLWEKLSNRWLVSPAMLPEAVINLAMTSWLRPQMLPVQVAFLLSTVYCLVATSYIKVRACRPRPAVSLKSAGILPCRTVNLTRYYIMPSEALKSFPSADAAEAAVLFASVAVARGRGTAWWWLLGAALPCFGRIYFLAHYALDVLAGFLIGLVTVLAVHAFFDVLQRSASPWDLPPALGAYAVLKLYVTPPTARERRG